MLQVWKQIDFVFFMFIPDNFDVQKELLQFWYLFI